MQPAQKPSISLQYGRAQRIIILRAVIMCIVAAVFGSHLYPMYLRIAVMAWGFIGLILVAWKALVVRHAQGDGLAALNPAHRIGIIHTIGVLGFGAFLAFVNQGLNHATNMVLAGVMIGAILINLWKLVVGLGAERKTAEGSSPGRKVLMGGAVVVIAFLVSVLIEFHGFQKNTSFEPMLTQDSTYTIQPDGLVHGSVKVSCSNETDKAIENTKFINSDFIHVENIHDENRQPVAFEARPGKGNVIEYNLTFNDPVPPGGVVFYTCEGTQTGMIKATDEPDVFEYSMKHWPAYNGITRRIERHVLPPGAVLVDKSPDDLKSETVGDHIELSIDRNIPPGGHIEVHCRYRLESSITSEQSATFGPVIERILYSVAVQRPVKAEDLDTGREIEVPNDFWGVRY